MTVGSYTLPSFGSPILWNYDFRHILAGELDLARYREKTEPYYRGETWIRPPFLDHAEDSEASTDVGSDSETMAGDSDSETEGYVEGDVPVHAHPRPRWSSNFYEDCSPFGIRPPRTPSPPPLPTTEALTHIYTQAELEYHGFEAHLNWQGPTPLTDRKGRIIGVLVDSPCEKSDWNSVVTAAMAAINTVRPHVDFTAVPPHGNTPNSLRWGIEYYGWGATSAQAQNLKHENLDNLIELSLLRQTGAFCEISALQNTIHQRCAPRLLAYVRHTKDVLMANDPTLRDNCTGGAFPAVEFFLRNDESPPTLHDLDMMWSWRALTALGKYDARWGGELILWDEKKIFKFPPGATFLFPGRLIRYLFTQVRSGETQYSFGQYAQAGLFRYVENGFMSEANFEATAWKLQREARDRMRDARMVKALGMYSLLNEIYQ